MSIKDLHDKILLIARKQKRGNITHSTIDHALEMASNDLFIDFYGNDKGYQPGRPVPPVVYGETMFVHSALRPFMRKHTFTVTTTPDGVISMPDDCWFPTAVHTLVFNSRAGAEIVRRVELLTEEEVIDRMSSHLVPASANRPVALIGGTDSVLIQLYPTVPQKGTAFYLKKPAVPVYAFTMDGRVEVFDEANSVDLEWGDAYKNRIIFKALSYIGINLSDQEIQQFAELKDSKGS